MLSNRYLTVILERKRVRLDCFNDGISYCYLIYIQKTCQTLALENSYKPMV